MNSKKVAIASVFGALSALFEIIPGPPFDIPFPLMPRISWDVTGIPMMITLLLFGFSHSIYTAFIGCLVIFIRGNLYGGIFKLIAELSTLAGFTLIRRNIIVRSTIAATSRVSVMTAANYYLLQLFYQIPERVVVGLLAPIAVFNATQTLINIIPAYFIYTRLKAFARPPFIRVEKNPNNLRKMLYGMSLCKYSRMLRARSSWMTTVIP